MHDLGSSKFRQIGEHLSVPRAGWVFKICCNFSAGYPSDTYQSR